MRKSIVSVLVVLLLTTTFFTGCLDFEDSSITEFRVTNQSELNAAISDIRTKSDNDFTIIVTENFSLSTSIYFDVNGKTFTLKSEGNKTLSTIDDMNGSFMVGSFDGGDSTTLILENISINMGKSVWDLFSVNKGSTLEIRSGVTLTSKNTVVDVSGTLIMDDGELTGGDGASGTVSVRDKGSFTMRGGKIAGNKVWFSYGAVYVNDGSFTMEGGEISGNSGGRGTVYVNDGSFTMTGGKIAGNTGDYSGGVYVYKDTATFTKTGGTIYGSETGAGTNKNTAESSYGAATAYIDRTSPLKREQTAGLTDNLDSANSSKAGGWDE